MTEALARAEDAERGGGAGRRARADASAQQHASFAAEQLAAANRAMASKDRQLAALKGERAELSAALDAAAGPGGAHRLAQRYEADAAARAEAAERARDVARRERDALASALEAAPPPSGGAAAVAAAVAAARRAAAAAAAAAAADSGDGGGGGGGVGEGAPTAADLLSDAKTSRERAALERLDEAEAAVAALKRERVALRCELDAAVAVASPDAARAASTQADRADAEARRAEVAERQLGGVKAERAALRARIEELEAELGSVPTDDPLPSTTRGAALLAHVVSSQVRHELEGAREAVAGVMERLREREAVLAKVLARASAPPGARARYHAPPPGVDVPLQPPPRRAGGAARVGA